MQVVSPVWRSKIWRFWQIYVIVGGVRTKDWLIIRACAINFMDNETKCNFIRFAIVGNNGSEMTLSIHTMDKQFEFH
mgnify:CR=1 FL=1